MVSGRDTSLVPPGHNSSNVDPMEVIGTKGSIALGALALSGVIACFHTLKAEDVKALGEDGILLAHVTAWAGEACLEERDALVRA